MSFSRFCCWSQSSRIGRFPTSLRLILLHHAKKETHCVSRFESRRTLFTNNSFHLSSAKNMSEQIAVSNPRLHQKLKLERLKDNLSEDWDLIFTMKPFRWKLQLMHCVSLIGLVVLPFIAVYLLWELQEEEDVLFNGLQIKSQTQLGIFMALHLTVFGLIFRTVRRVPNRIYLNFKTEQYLIVSSPVIPWTKPVGTICRATDIKPMPKRIFPFNFTLWKDTVFKVHNSPFMLSHMGFRSGHDRYWMTRHVNCFPNSDE